MSNMEYISISEKELREMFDEYLDEVFPCTNIAGIEYPTSHAMKNTDRIAYNQEFLNWLDNEISEDRIVEEGDNYFIGEA